MDSSCDNCWYNTYDEDEEEYYCNLILDEDEYARFIGEKSRTCRYFRPDKGEYEIVRKQN